MLRSKKLDAVARRLQEGVQARRTLVQAKLFLERLLAGETLLAVDGDLCVFRPDKAGLRNGVGVIHDVPHGEHQNRIADLYIIVFLQ